MLAVVFVVADALLPVVVFGLADALPPCPIAFTVVEGHLYEIVVLLVAVIVADEHFNEGFVLAKFVLIVEFVLVVLLAFVLIVLLAFALIVLLADNCAVFAFADFTAGVVLALLVCVPFACT